MIYNWEVRTMPKYTEVSVAKLDFNNNFEKLCKQEIIPINNFAKKQERLVSVFM